LQALPEFLHRRRRAAGTAKGQGLGAGDVPLWQIPGRADIA
jgi:hypothetical protein